MDNPVVMQKHTEFERATPEELGNMANASGGKAACATERIPNGCSCLSSAVRLQRHRHKATE